jgi:hypothetical protein
MATGIHRVTASSKRGRQLTSGGGKNFYDWQQAPDIAAHNAEVERKRQEKKAAKKNK